MDGTSSRPSQSFCPYCGSHHRPDGTSCPGCGVSLQHPLRRKARDILRTRPLAQFASDVEQWQEAAEYGAILLRKHLQAPCLDPVTAELVQLHCSQVGLVAEAFDSFCEAAEAARAGDLEARSVAAERMSWTMLQSELALYLMLRIRENSAEMLAVLRDIDVSEL